jgi:hypothetical protein
VHRGQVLQHDTILRLMYIVYVLEPEVGLSVEVDPVEVLHLFVLGAVHCRYGDYVQRQQGLPWSLQGWCSLLSKDATSMPGGALPYMMQVHRAMIVWDVSDWKEPRSVLQHHTFVLADRPQAHHNCTAQAQPLAYAGNPFTGGSSHAAGP